MRFQSPYLNERKQQQKHDGIESRTFETNKTLSK